jgi:hypothetical protein
MPELDVTDAERRDEGRGDDEPQRDLGRGFAAQGLRTAGDAIVVALPPADGAAVAAALRARGFAVAECNLVEVGARAARDDARVVVIDVDAPGVDDALEEVRESTSAELLLVGALPRGAFPRPLDVEAIVRAVQGTTAPRHATSPPATLLPGSAAGVPHRDSDAPPSEYPSASDPLDVAELLPTLDEVEGSVVIAPPQLSPDLQRILDAAEERVSPLAHALPSSTPASDDDDVDLLLPAELLALLDEPLDPDDEPSASASTGGTANLRPRTGRETTGSGTAAGDARGPGTGADTAHGDRDALTGPGSVSFGMQHVGFSGALPRPPLEPRVIVDPREPALRAASAEARAAIEREGPDGGPRPPVPASQALLPVGAPLAPPPAAVATPTWDPLQARQPDSGAGAPAADERVRAEPAPPPPPRYAAHEQPAPAAPMDPRVPAIAELRLPAVLGEGDAVRAVAAVIAARASGSLALGPDGAVRRVVLHDGDVVTTASGSPDETLVAFLAARGDLERDVAASLANRLPPHGRHAGAALIAHGHLGQEDLWPVLRAHAEWILGRALLCDEGSCELEPEPPGRLRAEPNVFGGATGAEVFLEQVRRVVPADVALRRLGGPEARLADGPRRQLLVECALRSDDEQAVRGASGRRVGELLAEGDAELADVLYGLASLGVLESVAPAAPRAAAATAFDGIDEEALRKRVRARVALVEDGDYFALLGIARGATGYEVRRAYLELRRAFEPGRVLTAATADLAADVRLVVEVLDEAYEVLREPHRRDRYRRAIEAGPP